MSAAGSSKRWREKNREKVLAYAASYRAENKRAIAEYRRSYHASNKHKYAAYRALAKARKVGAAPSWADRFLIEEAYHLAELRTDATGFPWEVDHIVPIRSKVVCGLHVHHNLRVVPAVVNWRKGNSFNIGE